MPRGGVRRGAGRPKGQGQYGEATKALRIPLSLVNGVMGYITKSGYLLPLYSNKVQAGSPSVANDHVENKIDLNDFLVRDHKSTFLVKVTGDSMINAGIHQDDILVVDTDLEAIHGKIVIAFIDGGITVKRLFRKDGRLRLMPENAAHLPIDVYEGNELEILGVVTNVIHGV